MDEINLVCFILQSVTFFTFNSMDHDPYIYDDVRVLESPPTIPTEYEPYDDDEYISPTTPGHMKCGEQRAPTLNCESQHDSSHIQSSRTDAANNFEFEATALDKSYALKNIINNQIESHQSALLDTCATPDNILLSLPDYDSDIIVTQN